MIHLKNKLVYAVDFDGTLCENKWPAIGRPRYGMLNHIKKLKKHGHFIILWTCREGKELTDAILWCKYHGVEFHAHNQNVKHRVVEFGNDPRKVGADVYIDDKSMSPKWWWL